MDASVTKELVESKSTTWKAWIAVFVVVGFIIVVVNTLTLYTFIRTPSLKTRKHIMTINLAVADLIYGALGIPSATYYVFKPTFISFQVSQTLNQFSKAACLFTLLAIAVERMHAIVWPLRHKVMNNSVYKIALVAIWILSAGVIAVNNYNRGKFGETPKFGVLVLPITIFGVTFTTVACYVCIWITVRRRRQRRLSTAAKQDRSLALTLLLVTGVFIVTWALPMFYMTVSLMCESCYQISDLGLRCVMLLFALQSLANPIIYCFRLPTFKMSMKMRLQGMKLSVCMEPRRRLRTRKVTAETELANTLVITENETPAVDCTSN